MLHFSPASSEVFALAIDGIQTGNSCTDTDGDGIPNSRDLDSDGDGCLDTIEAGTSNDGILPQMPTTTVF